jgi:prepilin-type N-terminal cleavage/methylation domain-containing protein
MYKVKNNKGFTLLEIIIVIIIIGVLASLALPRFFATVEYSRSTEALNSISALRQSLERCYLQNNGDYSAPTACNNGDGTLDIADPGLSPNAHFTYAITDQSATDYTITALRNGVDNGDGTSTIVVAQTGGSITRTGTGVFSAIK